MCNEGAPKTASPYVSSTRSKIKVKSRYGVTVQSLPCEHMWRLSPHTMHHCDNFQLRTRQRCVRLTASASVAGAIQGGNSEQLEFDFRRVLTDWLGTGYRPPRVHQTTLSEQTQQHSESTTNNVETAVTCWKYGADSKRSLREHSWLLSAIHSNAGGKRRSGALANVTMARPARVWEYMYLLPSKTRNFQLQ